METLLERAGLVDEGGKALTTMHGLRATGSSLAAAAGVSKQLIREQMGHVGDDVTERRYIDIGVAIERFQFAAVFGPVARLGDAGPAALRLVV